MAPILFNFDISIMFFFFFLIIDLYFLVPAVIVKIFNPIAELVTPLVIPIKEPEAEI